MTMRNAAGNPCCQTIYSIAFFVCFFLHFLRLMITWPIRAHQITHVYCVSYPIAMMNFSRRTPFVAHKKTKNCFKKIKFELMIDDKIHTLHEKRKSAPYRRPPPTPPTHQCTLHRWHQKTDQFHKSHAKGARTQSQTIIIIIIHNNHFHRVWQRDE